jgi:hypothetical protein
MPTQNMAEVLPSKGTPDMYKRNRYLIVEIDPVVCAGSDEKRDLAEKVLKR